MQRSLLQQVSRMALTGGAAALGLLGTTSCKLPPREAWTQIQQRGLLPVIFNPLTPDTGNSYAGRSGSNPAPVVTAAPDGVYKVQAVRQAGETDPLPIAAMVPGLPGYVFSPHTAGKKLIDARKFTAGSEVRCPYTLKAFLIPGAPLETPAPSAPPPGPVAQLVSRQAPDPGIYRLREDAVPDLPLPGDEPAPVTPPPSAPSQPESASGPGLPDIPYGTRVAGRPGFVYSPFASKNQLVDVAGIAPGVEVKCPYTEKLFRVPELLPEEMTPAPPTVIPPAPAAPQDSPALPDPASGPLPAPSVPPAGNESAEPAPVPPAAAGAASSNLPTAAWVDRQKHQVQSPFGSPGQLIDVTGRPSGSTMLCPYTNKEFVIP